MTTNIALTPVIPCPLICIHRDNNYNVISQLKYKHLTNIMNINGVSSNEYINDMFILHSKITSNDHDRRLINNKHIGRIYMSNSQSKSKIKT